jgi:hypothetical protein
MKKKFLAAIALTLSTLTLAACNPTNQTLTFYANWEKTVISEANNASEETLTYYITHEASSFLQKDYYDVKYCYAEGKEKPGVYTTTLKYDTTGTYLYQTSLTIDVTFILANGDSVTKTDTVVTEARFKKATSSFQPIYSKKTVHAHAPRNGEVTALENVYDAEGKLTQVGAFVEYDYEFAITYNDNLTGGKLTKTDLSEHNTLGLKDGKQEIEFSIADTEYTYLDNEQYLFALRAISSDQLSAASKTVSMYNASLMTMETVATTPSTTAKSTFQFQLNGGEKTSYEIEYVELQSKTSNKHAILSQTLCYAKTTDMHDNRFRNVLLKMSAPMYFGLGTLHYTLASANFSTES